MTVWYITTLPKQKSSPLTNAILQQIHRAILTAPSPSEIPNIEFTILVNDHPGANVWSLARHSAPSAANKEVNNTWLMPDYGFWSWPEPHIGSLDGVKEKVGKVEEGLTWDTKISKAVWRGSVHWNSGLRGQLVEQAKGKAWSDVQQLNWKKNALSMEDFCKYKYLMYTEGVTYSGRLRYFQLCRSIIISPPLQWRTHLSPLLHPQGPNQNIVLVKEDWSDLDDVIKHLEANPLEAERIANNTVNTFREWYLTPAMEVCYWRKMFRAWAEVTDAVGDVKLGDRGTRWESFVLMGRLEWDRTA
ncbi:DUF821 domain protein [Venturia nashicola]|nr:DUF821 domain protein [Venturia nashicola]